MNVSLTNFCLSKDMMCRRGGDFCPAIFCKWSIKSISSPADHAGTWHHPSFDPSRRIFCRPGIFGLGVADGVYMWKTKGIDSGVFSRTLMGSALKGLADGMDDVVKRYPPPPPPPYTFLSLYPPLPNSSPSRIPSSSTTSLKTPRLPLAWSRKLPARPSSAL